MYLIYSVSSRHFFWLLCCVSLLFQDINGAIMQAPDFIARGQHVSEESVKYATEANNDLDANFQERDWFPGNNEDQQDLFDETDLDDNFSEELENIERGMVNLTQPVGYVGRSLTSGPCLANFLEKKSDGKCDCALSYHTACSIDYNGMVCDDCGNTYSSLCEATWKICMGIIAVSTDINFICPGRCQLLKLTGSETYPDENGDHGLGIFEYVSGSDRDTLRYSSRDNGYDLYYEQMPELKGWNIGKMEDGHQKVTYRFFNSEKVNMPQYLKGAELVPQNIKKDNRWTADGSIKFVCVKDRPPPLKKRFFGLFALIISLIVIAVSTTLQIIQAVKGCLYTDLCQQKKEIEVIRPRVQKLKTKYETDFGSPATQYQIELEELQTKTRTLNAKLVLINDILRKLNKGEGGTVEKNSVIAKLDTSSQTALAPFEELAEFAKISVITTSVGFVLAAIEVVYFVVKVVASTVKASTLAIAGAFAIVGAVLAIVDIAVSVIKEKEARTKAVKIKNDLLDGERALRKARTDMGEVQMNVTNQVVFPLRDFARSSQQAFANRQVGEALILLNGITHYNQLTLAKLVQVNIAADKLVSFVDAYYTQLKNRYLSQKEAKDYINNLVATIRTREHSPMNLFNTVKSSRPQGITHYNQLTLAKLVQVNIAADKLVSFVDAYYTQLKNRYLSQKEAKDYINNLVATIRTREHSPMNLFNTVKSSRPQALLEECRVGSGESYNGTVSVTRTGLFCQEWAAIIPHIHTYGPRLRDQSNFCRNPGGEHVPGPWCYTTDPATRWEVCDIKTPCEGTNQLDTFNQFLEFVAFDALKTSSCYWGYDLTQIRFEMQSCKKANRKMCSHPQTRICDSTAMAQYKRRIQTEVNNNEPLCIIKQKLNKTPFTSIYLIIRFIADYIMPSSSCYYGYDLGRIRSGSLRALDVNQGIVDFSTFHSLYALNTVIVSGALSTSKIQEGICTNKKVCDLNWQNFIKCLVKDQLAKGPDGTIIWDVSDCTKPVTCNMLTTLRDQKNC